MYADITQEPRPLAQQALAAEALVGLTMMFGHLPAPFVTVHLPHLVQLAQLDFQLETPADFEAWRTALQLAPAAVTLHAYRSSTWLATETVFRGVCLKLTGHNLPLTEEQANTVQEFPQVVTA